MRGIGYRAHATTTRNLRWQSLSVRTGSSYYQTEVRPDDILKMPLVPSLSFRSNGMTARGDRAAAHQRADVEDAVVWSGQVLSDNNDDIAPARVRVEASGAESGSL